MLKRVEMSKERRRGGAKAKRLSSIFLIFLVFFGASHWAIFYVSSVRSTGGGVEGCVVTKDGGAGSGSQMGWTEELVEALDCFFQSVKGDLMYVMGRVVGRGGIVSHRRTNAACGEVEVCGIYD